MRSILILVGVLIAGALALVATLWHLDDRMIRTELQRIVQAAAGQDLAVRGAVRLELLPWPRLIMDRVTIGDPLARANATRLEADRIDIDVAPLTLLAGRVEPRRIQLVHPRLRLAADLPSVALDLQRAAASPPLSSLQRISIVDGVLERAPAEDMYWPRRVDAVDLELTRTAERDRLSVEGTVQVEDEPLRLLFQVEPLLPDTPKSLTLDIAGSSDGRPVGLRFQGLSRVQADDVHVEGTLTGQAAADGTWPAWLLRRLGSTGDLIPLLGPLGLNARLVWTASALRFDDLALSLAGGTLRGSLVTTRAPNPAFTLSLEGNQLAVSPELERGLREWRQADLPARLAGRAAVRIGALGWRGGSLRQLHAQAALVPGRPLTLERLDAVLPGETVLRWQTTESQDARLETAGELTLDVGDPRALAGWLGLDPADLAGEGFKSLALGARLEVESDLLTLTSIDARIDATRLTGSLSLTRDVRRRLAASLTADRLNGELYLPPGRMSLDLSRWREGLSAFDLAVDMAVERFAYGRLRGEDLRLQAEVEGGQLTLRELSLNDLGSARARIVGSADLAAGSYELAGDLALSEPKRLLRLLGMEPPPTLDQLAPWQATGMLRGDAGTAEIDAELSMQGARSALAGTLNTPFKTGLFDLTGRIEIAEAGKVITALGGVIRPGTSDFGPVDTALRLRREGQPVQIDLKSHGGTGSVEARLALGLGGRRPRLSGDVTAFSLDSSLLGAAYDALAIPLAFPPGSPATWPGAWPQTPLDWRWLSRLDLEIQLAARRSRDKSAEVPAARMGITLADGQLALSRIDLPFGGGRLAGVVTLEQSGEQAVFGADLQGRELRAGQVAALLVPEASLQGELDLDVQVVGSGRSLADIVGSLTGDGTLQLRDARQAAAGPNDHAAEAVQLGGPFTVNRGVVESAGAGLRLTTRDTQAELDVRLDLPAWLLDLRLDGKSADREGGSLRLRLLGPPGRLRPVSDRPLAAESAPSRP